MYTRVGTKLRVHYIHVMWVIPPIDNSADSACFELLLS